MPFPFVTSEYLSTEIISAEAAIRQDLVTMFKTAGAARVKTR
jgi:hypothetical protein